MIIKNLSLALFSLVILAGCGDGSSRGVKGTACPRGKYDPYPQEIKAETIKKYAIEKIDISDPALLPKGTYNYVSGDFIYINNEINKGRTGKAANLQLVAHIREFKFKKHKNSKPELDSARVCMAGFHSGVELAADLDLITDISKLTALPPQPNVKVLPDVTSINVKNYGFTFNEEGAKPVVEKTSNKLNMSPKQYFVDEIYEGAEIVLYKYGKTAADPGKESYNVELRGSLKQIDKSGHEATYKFSVRYLFTPEDEIESPTTESEVDEETPESL